MSPRASGARVARLEDSLSPRSAVLLWLAEAMAYPSLPAYARSLTERPPGEWPLEAIGARVEAAVRGSMRGRTREAVRTAGWQAIREAFFLFELVEHINLAAVEALDQAWPSLGLLASQMRCLALESEIPEYRTHPLGGRALAVRATEWREALSCFLTNLYEAEEARLALERRYLDGHSCLFAEPADDLARLLERAEGLAEIADQLAAMPATASPARRERRPKVREFDLGALRKASRAQAARSAAVLVDSARCATLDLLGEGAAAVAILERRLRLPSGANEGPRAGLGVDQ
jgi:hypothetical protein